MRTNLRCAVCGKEFYDDPEVVARCSTCNQPFCEDCIKTGRSCHEHEHCKPE